MINIPHELQSAAEDAIAKYTAPINAIVDKVLAATAFEPKNSSVSLTPEDMYAIAIRLPAECAYLQSVINSKQLDAKLHSFLLNAQITNSIVSLQGSRGDATERKRRAEAMSADDMLVDIVKRQIVEALNDTIVRADKVYEGVKKVIDAKSREFGYDKKPGYPVG